MTPRAEDFLQRASLMRFVPAEQYPRLRDLFVEVSFDFGQPIVRQGEAADAYYVLVSGRARVLKETPGGETPLNRLVPGEECGEGALLEGGAHGVTVRASTAVEALRLGRDDFTALLAAQPEIRTALELVVRWRTLHGFLYEFSNFGRLPAPALQSLMQGLQPARATKGEVIIRQGDPAGPMFIVQSGRVRVYTGTGERRVNRAFYRPGDYFGELAVLTGSPRAATAEAVTDCTLLALAPDVVRSLRARFPEFDRLLNERLAQYRAAEDARVPLDFAAELLPADTRAAEKTADAGETTAADDGDPFAEDGLFRKRPDRLRRFPYVAQIDAMDCGAASLAMVCRHFGRNVSLARIRALCHTASDGTSLKAICAAATELGLAARALKISSRHLDQMPLPAICHWEGNHWLVLHDVGPRHVRIADPGKGLQRVRRDVFLSKWSGYTALFDYTAAFEQAPESTATLAWMRPFVAGHGRTITLALGLAGLTSLLTLLFPVLTQFVVDKVIVDRDVGLLSIVLLAMTTALGFLLAANLIQQYLLSFVAVRIDSAVLDFLTRRLLALPMSYFNARRTGDIQRRLDGARLVRQFLVQQGVGGALAVVQLVCCVGLMVAYSPRLAGIFVLVLPLYGALLWFSRRVLRPLLADLEEAHARYASHQIDAIRGMEAVKAAGAELGFRDAMLTQFLSVSRQQFRGNFTMLAYESALNAIALGSTILFLWAGANQVIDGAFSVGAFVAFSSLMALASASILRALSVWDDAQYVSVLLNRLNDLFEHEPEQGEDRSRLAPVKSLEGHLELRQVGFRYGGPESPAILQGITLEIPSGRTYAIVGRSGSGKTTLVKLIAGLLDATEGTVLFDRVDSRTLNHRDLRRQIGFVLQENHLFDDTIARNIAFGEAEPDFDRVLQVAQLANAHEFIQRLPMGYETRIGETGLALSGGQRQRIAIARALYPNPPILIFDEATSALDTESERAIQQNLTQLTQGRTCLIIAHRLSTIREAHHIVVLEQGRVAETGTHDELMARRGLYFYLSSQQLGLS